MDNKRPDVTEILIKERDWYADQIKRINLALSVLKGDMNPGDLSDKHVVKRRIQWSKEVDRIFKEQGHNHLNVDSICDLLAENGIPEALDASNRNTIYSTVSRKTGKDGYLVKNDDGVYCKIQEGNDKINEEYKVDDLF